MNFKNKINLLKNFYLFFFIVSIFVIKPSFSNSEQFNFYADLVQDWSKIFPDQNRNAAGPKFFKHILNKEITYQDFVEYNKLYCAVSGSLIEPNNRPEFVYLKSDENDEKICGFYQGI